MIMKKTLLGMLTVAAGLCFGAANDTVITFSTPGPDTYSDGSTVLDGECYALVWTKDGATFGGLTADCKPVAATDKVVLIAPAAKGGRCPTTVFEINAKYAERHLKGGTYAVYLLDTRVSKTQLAKVVKGVPESVNSFGATTFDENGKVIRLAASGLGNAAVPSAAVALGEVGVLSVIERPVITAMKVDGATVSITVSGMSGAADYFVVPGKGPGKFAEALSVRPEGDTFTFDKPDDAAFFKVIGTRKFE